MLNETSNLENPDLINMHNRMTDKQSFVDKQPRLNGKHKYSNRTKGEIHAKTTR